MVKTFRRHLSEKIKDQGFKKEYGAALAKTELALTLYKARKSAEYTQEKLANKCGVSQSYIAKLEYGDANPSIGTIGKILSVLDVRLITRFSPINSEQIPSIT